MGKAGNVKRWWAVCGVVVLSACGGGGGGGGDECPEGFEPNGTGCVPIFDECPGRVEIPGLGGGCRSVGVTACAAS